jgi:hypothetical protein
MFVKPKRLIRITEIQTGILKELHPLHLQPAVLERRSQPKDQQAQKQPAQHGYPR